MWPWLEKQNVSVPEKMTLQNTFSLTNSTIDRVTWELLRGDEWPLGSCKQESLWDPRNGSQPEPRTDRQGSSRSAAGARRIGTAVQLTEQALPFCLRYPLLSLPMCSWELWSPLWSADTLDDSAQVSLQSNTVSFFAPAPLWFAAAVTLHSPAKPTCLHLFIEPNVSTAVPWGWLPSLRMWVACGSARFLTAFHILSVLVLLPLASFLWDIPVVSTHLHHSWCFIHTPSAGCMVWSFAHLFLLFFKFPLSLGISGIKLVTLLIPAANTCKTCGTVTAR